MKPEELAEEYAKETASTREGSRSRDAVALFARKDFLAGFEAGVEARGERLERALRQIQNSVAIASWSIKPEFVEWSKAMNQVINEALSKIDTSGKVE